MTYFSQMAGLAVQNFVSAAVGICVAGRASSAGSPRRGGARARQLLGGPRPARCSTCCCRSRSSARCCSSRRASSRPSTATGRYARSPAASRRSRVGPVASQDRHQAARHQRRRLLQRQLGDAVREPDRALELRRDAVDPADPGALTATYGRMVGSRRQGWAIFAAMAILFVVGVAVVYAAEQHGSPAQHAAGVAPTARRHHRRQPRGQGAALRDRQLGARGPRSRRSPRAASVNAALESLHRPRRRRAARQHARPARSSSAASAPASTGCCCSSCSPSSSRGLMVGRTPEYLGKKIEAREIKLRR